MAAFISKFLSTTTKLGGILSQNPNFPSILEDLQKLYKDVEKQAEFQAFIVKYQAENSKKLKVLFDSLLMWTFLITSHSIFNFQS